MHGPQITRSKHGAASAAAPCLQVRQAPIDRIWHFSRFWLIRCAWQGYHRNFRFRSCVDQLWRQRRCGGRRSPTAAADSRTSTRSTIPNERVRRRPHQSAGGSGLPRGRFRSSSSACGENDCRDVAKKCAVLSRLGGSTRRQRGHVSQPRRYLPQRLLLFENEALRSRALPQR